MVGPPLAHSMMSQLDVPARAVGQRTVQLDPSRQVVWQGGVAHVKPHVLAAKQVHWPLAHTPVHELLGSQVTWHGGASQAKSQWLPLPHTQLPLAQAAVHSGLSPLQVTWQGGASHVNRQRAPAEQVQSPLSQPPPGRQDRRAPAMVAAAATTSGTRTKRDEVDRDDMRDKLPHACGETNGELHGGVTRARRAP